METFGVWLQALITIALISAVFKDNPAYRYCEHIYIGLFAGYQVCTRWFLFIRPTVATSILAEGKWSYVFPLVLGLLAYTRFIKPIAWLSRFSICFLMGIGSGYALAKDFKPFFVDQIRATGLPLWVAGDPWSTFSNWVMVFGTVATLVYFIFYLPKKGAPGRISGIGRWVMMVAFGATFGNSVMGRLSVFLGRMQFLLRDWLKLI